MKIITRKEAKAHGLKRYFTGQPCVHGHLVERRTKTGYCLECQKAYKRRAYARNPIAQRLGSKKWSAGNKDRKKRTDAEYREKNRQRLSEQKKERYTLTRVERQRVNLAWAKKNPEKTKAIKKRWRQNNPDKVKAHHKNSKAARRGAEGKHTAADIRRLVAAQQHRCANPVCRRVFGEVGYHEDHIIPIKLGGSNRIENIQLLCPPCNRAKSDKHPEKWLSDIGALA